MTLVILALGSSSSWAQIPGINYQGVARNLDGSPKALQNISLRISVLAGSDTGPVEYSETHEVSTNEFGLFQVAIGQGDPESGTFQAIDWSQLGKWISVEMDPDGGFSYQLVGSQQMLGVPYALYAERAGESLQAGDGVEIADNRIMNTAPDQVINFSSTGSVNVLGSYPNFTITGTDNVDDADADAANELLTGASLQPGAILRISDAGGDYDVDLSSLVTNPIDPTLSQVLDEGNDAGGFTIGNVGDPVLSQDVATKAYVDNLNVDDSDADPLNEIQDLQLLGDMLSITNGGVTLIDLTPYLDNTDSQDLTRTGNTLSLTGDATAVDLSPYLDNTDSQDLGNTVSGTSRTITITGGASTTFSIADNDNSSSNEIQDLSRSGNTLSLSGDGTSVDLAPYLDNTDNQDLGNTVSGTNRTVTITGGNSTTFSVADNDNSTSNEIQDLSRSGNTLSLSGDGTSVDLSPYLDNTDNQDLGNTVSGTNRTVTITGGNSTTFSVADNDNSTSNEIQDLSRSGNTLSLSGDGTSVDLSSYLDNTDNQNLGNTVSGTNRTITISGGSGTTFSVADNDNSSSNEIQDLSRSGNTLSLSGDGTSVDLSPYLDNTDNQNLGNTVSGTNRIITISGGTSTTISVADNDNSSSNEIQDLVDVLAQGNDANGNRIANVGDPLANSDVATKSYVDANDASVATNYAFRVDFNFTAGGGGANNELIDLSSPVFDNSNVLSGSSFTAPVDGVYIFHVSANSGSDMPMSVIANGVPEAVNRASGFAPFLANYNGAKVYNLTAGQTVQLRVDSGIAGANVTGSFFGYRL